MNRRGFTVIELIVVITVISILLIIGVINLNGVQADSRDAERKADIETIAVNLETYYKSGNDNNTTSLGQYPAVDSTNNFIGNETFFLRDIDASSLMAPGTTSSSLISATNSTQTVSSISPQPTTAQYVYQPIATDGSLCDSLTAKECRKFNLYYKLEIDNTVYMVTSKNQ